jgi:hypothetical protein
VVKGGGVKRTRWEYHVLMRDLIDEAAGADAFAEVRALGENGWELVSVNYLTAYAPSLEPHRAEDDVIERMRKRLNGTLGRTSYATTTAARPTNGRAGVETHAPPTRIDALPETRLEAWFKRPT